MIALLALLALGTAAVEEAPAHPLDPFMLDVTEGCLLPDISKADPRAYFLSNGWKRISPAKFSRRIGQANYTVKVAWPSSKKASASCSFSSDDVAVSDVYSWFKNRIGEPQDIPWSAQQVGGWKIITNDHDAGIYLSRKNKKTADGVGMMLHILQN